MSKFVSGLLGAAALVASLGVAQFAVGHDLSGTTAQVAAAAQSDHVNRAAKSDRAVGVATSVGSSTVTRSDAANETLVVVKTPNQPVVQRNSNVGGPVTRRPVACEAPASVLTEIAKRMESGRCIT